MTTSAWWDKFDTNGDVGIMIITFAMAPFVLPYVWTHRAMIAACRKYLHNFDGYAANHGSMVYKWNWYRLAMKIVHGKDV